MCNLKMSVSSHKAAVSDTLEWECIGACHNLTKAASSSTKLRFCGVAPSRMAISAQHNLSWPIL